MWTSRAGWTSFALRALRACRAYWTRIASRPGCAWIALRSLAPGWTSIALRALRAGVSGVALWPLWPGCSGVSLRYAESKNGICRGSYICDGGAFAGGKRGGCPYVHSRRALRSCWPLWSGRSGRAGWSNWSLPTSYCDNVIVVSVNCYCVVAHWSKGGVVTYLEFPLEVRFRIVAGCAYFNVVVVVPINYVENFVDDNLTA